MSELRLETVLRSERIVVGVSLTILAAAAWLYLLYLPAAMPTHEPSMTGMPGMHVMSAATMPGSQAPRWTDVGALTGMWTVMMVAMMTPAAAPMIATFADLSRPHPPPSDQPREPQRSSVRDFGFQPIEIMII